MFQVSHMRAKAAFSAGNSGYTDREEYEEENGRKNCPLPMWTLVDQ